MLKLVSALLLLAGVGIVFLRGAGSGADGYPEALTALASAELEPHVLQRIILLQ